MQKIIFTTGVILLFLALPCWGNEKGFVDIRAIPKTGFNVDRTISGIGEYDGKGRIDGVFNDRIVINDANFNLSNTVTLQTPNGKSFLGNLDKGMYIYYFLDPSNSKLTKIIIDSTN